jgi:hypothetical protein
MNRFDKGWKLSTCVCTDREWAWQKKDLYDLG